MSLVCEETSNAVDLFYMTLHENKKFIPQVSFFSGISSPYSSTIQTSEACIITLCTPLNQLNTFFSSSDSS